MKLGAEQTALQASVAGISFWSYSLISIAVCLVVGLIVSAIDRKVRGDKIPETNIFTTVFGKKAAEKA